MKKIISKILFGIVVVISIFLIRSQSAFAYCGNQFGEKKFGDSIALDRTGDNPKFSIDFTMGVRSDYPDCKGVTVDPNFYDFSVSLFNEGWGSWKDTEIPDSSVVLKAGTTTKIIGIPSIKMSPDAIYRVKFKEENELPDLESKNVLTWIDTTDFGTISVIDNTLTSTGAEITGTVTYNNKAAQIDNKSIPAVNIVAKVYKENGTFVNEFPISSGLFLTYGRTNTLTAKITGLQPDTAYYVIFLDKGRYNAKSYSKSFTTKPISNTGTGTGTNTGTGTGTGTNTGTGQTSTKFAVGNTVKVTVATLNVRSTANGTLSGTQPSGAIGTVTSGPTATGGYNWWKINFSSGVDGWSIENSLEKCTTNCNTSSTPTTTENTTTGLLRFEAISGTAQNAVAPFYPGTKIVGSITPSIHGSDLVIDGDITYVRTGSGNEARIANLGRTSFHLTDSTGATAQIKVEQLGIDGLLEYDVPYRFSVTFPNYNRFIDQSGNLINASTRQAPFSVYVVEDQLYAKSQALRVVTNTPTSNTGSNTTTDTGTGDVQTSTSTGTNNVSTTFEMTASLDISQNVADVAGIVTYGRDLTAGEWADKVNNMKVIIYRPNGELLTIEDMNVNYVSARKANIKAVVPQVDPSVGPYKYVVWDRVFDVHSNQFELKQNGQISTANTANGESISFKITNAVANTITGKLELAGTVTYGHSLTANEISSKTNKMVIEVYDKNQEKSTGVLLVTKLNNTTLAIAHTDQQFGFTDTNAPYTFKLKDNDSNVYAPNTFSLKTTGSTNNSLFQGQSATVDGTTVTFSDPVITPGATAATSIVATTSVKYENSSKQNTDTVSNAQIIAKLFSVDAQGSLVDNSTIPITVAAKYNQPTTVTANLTNLDAAKKYAVQFKEASYNPAKSLAKVIESKNGKFTESLDQPGSHNSGSGSSQTPGAPSGGRGTLGSPLKDGLDSIPGIVGILVDDVVIPIAIPILAIAIMYTGFLFVKARGNATALEEAKKALKWTLIGGAIILASKVISLALQSTIADIVRNS